MLANEGRFPGISRRMIRSFPEGVGSNCSSQYRRRPSPSLSRGMRSAIRAPMAKSKPARSSPDLGERATAAWGKPLNIDRTSGVQEAPGPTSRKKRAPAAWARRTRSTIEIGPRAASTKASATMSLSGGMAAGQPARKSLRPGGRLTGPWWRWRQASAMEVAIGPCTEVPLGRRIGSMPSLWASSERATPSPPTRTRAGANSING